MQLLSKKDLVTKFGKTSMWGAKVNFASNTYIEGLPAFDQILEAGKNNLMLSKNFTFIWRPKGLELNTSYGLGKYHYFGLTYNEIKSVSLENPEQIYEKKEKSVLGRAIIGGLLLGPAGAIVGGMTGLKDGVKKSEMPELLLTIDCVVDGSDILLIFSTPFRHKQKQIDFFKNTLKERFYLLE